MPNAWNGPDPVADAFPTAQEIGTEFRAEVDVTLTHVRVWADATELNQTSRKARIWSTGGGQLGIATLPDDLPTGWSTHALDVPVTRLAGQRFIVSFTTGGNEGYALHALDSDVPSADSAITALSSANASGGNGRFTLSVGTFPGSASGNASFFGADVVYTLGIGGNTAPRITQMTAVPTGATVLATVVAVDDETLVGSTTRFSWGDGGSDTVVTYPTISASHTYAASGDYAVLATVTDASAAADYAAVPVHVDVPQSGVQALGVGTLLNALVSHAMTSGYFERVNGYEPKNAPGNGLSCAIWLNKLGPARGQSGLSITSARIEFSVRIYSNMVQEPQNAIDPNVGLAADALYTAYHGDFELGGEARCIDLLGMAGPGLESITGYLTQDGKTYRVMDISVPIIRNDVWEQLP